MHEGGEYKVWVLQNDGTASVIAEPAASLEAARRALAARGYQVLDAASTGTHASLPAWLSLRRAAASRRARFDDLFAQQLQVLIRAGIGPVESLRALARQAHGPYAEALAQIETRLETGCGLADAVEADGRFDVLLVALLRAAEQTSDLDSALQRFLIHRQRIGALRQRIVTTAVYPVMLMGVGTLVLLFLLFYVLPRFSGIFQSLHTDLPWAATLMLQWGLAVRAHTGWVMGIGLVAVLAGGSVLTSQRLRALAAERLTRHGWLGEQVRLVHLCRYYRTLSSLLSGGIALKPSMLMANQLLPVHLQPSGAAALQQVNEGQAPAQALEASRLSTPVAHQLIQVGQRTGQLAQMLERTADFHDEDVSRSIERFMRVLEPAVMTAVGLAIGVVVVLMYLPIFELASAVR